MMFWSPSMGLIVLMERYGTLRPVQVMDAEGHIGIGGRYVDELPSDAKVLVTHKLEQSDAD